MSRNANRAWCVTARSLLIILSLTAQPLVAQEKPPTLPELLARVQDAEVYLQGYIGRGPEGEVRFVLADAKNNGFPADFKSEKDLDTAIKGCGFDGSGGLPCKVVAYGTYTGTYKITGKPFEARVAHVWKLKEGRITSFEQFVDSQPVNNSMD